jgi:hypothetical protein
LFQFTQAVKVASLAHKSRAISSKTCLSVSEKGCVEEIFNLLFSAKALSIKL